MTTYTYRIGDKLPLCDVVLGRVNPDTDVTGHWADLTDTVYAMDELPDGTVDTVDTLHSPAPVYGDTTHPTVVWFPAPNTDHSGVVRRTVHRRTVGENGSVETMTGEIIYVVEP